MEATMNNFSTHRCTIISLFLIFLAGSVSARAADMPSVPRTADGNPDFGGIWQALGTAHYNLEPHAADFPPLPMLGAVGSIPAGLGVVDGETIPYTASAREQQQTNKDNWLTLDPIVKCFMPGVPRANYLPFPFQIIQSTEHIVMAYEFANANRVVYMNRPDFEAPVFSWMGHSRGHFEGDSLVIDVTDQVPDTWLDHAGNHHTDALRVTERYTHIGPNALIYEATLVDPNVYTRPWTIRLPLYRRLDTDMQLLDFRCVEFAEELMYGHLSKDAGTP